MLDEDVFILVTSEVLFTVSSLFAPRLYLPIVASEVSDWEMTLD